MKIKSSCSTIRDYFANCFVAVFIAFIFVLNLPSYPASYDEVSPNIRGTAQEKKEEKTREVKLVPIPPTQLEHLEEAVRNQIIQGKKDVETVAANPTATNKSRGNAYGQLGQLYHAYKLTEAAEACYLNALVFDPDHLEWNYSIAYLYQTTGNFSRALEYYRQSQPQWKSTDLAYLYHIRIGECYKSMSRIPDAKKAFEAAYEINPQGPAVLARLGETALVEKKYDHAIKYFDSALIKQPQANKLHYSLAMAYRGKGDMKKAREELGKSGMVGIQPPDSVKTRLKQLKGGYYAHYQAGKLAYSAGRLREAVQEFEKAIKADPKKPGAYVNLGVTYVQFKAYREAIVQFEKAIEVDPQNMTAHYNLGEIYGFLNAPKKAVEHLKIVLEKNPGDAGAHLSMARAYLKLKQFDQALKHFKTSVRLEPELAKAWVGISTVYTARKKYANALQVLEKAYSKLPHSKEIARALANLLAISPLLKKRNGTKALQLASKVYEESKDYESAYIVALALAELNRCDESEKWLNHAIEIASKSPQTRGYARIMQSHLYYIKTHRPCRIPGEKSQ